MREARRRLTVLKRHKVPDRALAGCPSAPFDARYISDERRAALIIEADTLDIPKNDTTAAAEGIRRIAARMIFH